MTDFAIGESDFLLDGEPFRILSGALHYFRVHPDHWADRIEQGPPDGPEHHRDVRAVERARPGPGVFDTDGMLDLGRFLDLVAEAACTRSCGPGRTSARSGTTAGCRPGCSASRASGVRRDEPQFLARSRSTSTRYCALVRPRQVDQGGPVILVQVENEYGAYGDDPAYLRRSSTSSAEPGSTVPLITVDQPDDAMLAAGGLAGVLRDRFVRSRSAERLAHAARATSRPGR